ncbi:hypothetical protein ACGFMM_04675 [Streptomyces sp. NPDC048604]|uniref:hypothetical protein n=1 Tax=Streptomyces sp. NPDC048604 TaxID=3365578 RepID=UPI003710DC00
MAALAWLLIPLFAVVGAGIWAGWVSRNRTIGDVAELAGYARFRDAMERQHASTGSATGQLETASASSAPLAHHTQ